MNRRWLAVVAFLASSLLILLLQQGQAIGQQVHRNGFETRELGWQKGAADAPFREAIHETTDQTSPHTGQMCEHIQLTAEKGNFIHYFYPTSRAPICEELSIRIWLKANRPGMQLLARLVLPRERDPENLDAPLSVLLPGDRYQAASSSWQPLEVRRPVKLANEQQQLLRAKLKRDVDLTDAFVDRLILQVYGGPGLTDVWVDDLEISPVLDAEAPGKAPNSNQTNPAPKNDAAPTVRPPRVPGRAVVEINQEHLRIGGKPFFFRGVRVADAPLKTLRDAHLNTIWVDHATPPARLEEAIQLGFWLVPSLPVTADDLRLVTAAQLSQEIMRFSAGDAVLFWDLGGGLLDEQKDIVAQASRVVRSVDMQRPLGADVWDGFRPYSRNLDLIGVHRWPLMTMLELGAYRHWLNQRRLLARPGTFMWTWIQTHLPDWYTELVYQRTGISPFPEPIGPQPEQIRLLTYIALAAGCHGLGFWADRFLADSHQGRDRLLTLALLNLEMEMLEPLLLAASEPRWIDTSIGEVKAAVIRTNRGVLVLPIWLGSGSQFVPGQSASPRLEMIVPEVPAGSQPWEISPVETKALQTQRVAGGCKITVPEFSLTRAIVFTTDNNPTGLLVRLQDQTRRMRKIAAQWAISLAQVEIDKVMRVETELEQMNVTVPDAAALTDKARGFLKSSEEYWRNEDYRNAYAEAERALRPLRILMRAQWNQAVKGLDVPVSSPYAVSFFTLPRHYRFAREVAQMTPGGNVLPDGDFETLPQNSPESWTSQEASLDDMATSARRVTDNPKEGKQCLLLEIKPKHTVGPDGKPLLPPEGLERTFLAINSPAVRLQPGTLVRISAAMRIPSNIAASADGALFYDSAGGEPLAVRITNKMEWKRFTVYRTVPASGSIHVTLALSGLGKVYFDDIRIEPLGSPSTVLRPPVITVSRPATGNANKR